MCGIVGKVRIGSENLYTVVANGLVELQHRGYDSCGIALNNKEWDKPYVQKRLGAPSEQLLGAPSFIQPPEVAIGHTRWATSGPISRHNAHPHKSPNGRYLVVHNGIIENAYKQEIQRLVPDSYRYSTDTEILCALIESLDAFDCLDYNTIRSVTNLIEGDNAFVILDTKFDVLWVVADGRHLYYNQDGIVSSDTGIFTKDNVSLLKKGVIRLSPRVPYILTHDDSLIEEVKLLTLDFSTSNGINKKKKKSAYYMLDEIYEQKNLDVPEVERVCDPFEHIVMFGCGSSYYAGLLAQKQLRRNYAHRRIIEAQYATELCNEILNYDYMTTFVAISQSGETYDTIQAAKEIITHGAELIAVTNNPNSTLARMACSVVNIDMGEERGVASTKTFSGQYVALLAMLGYGRVVRKELSYYEKNLQHIFDHIHTVKDIAKFVSDYPNCLCLGSGAMYPTAIEASLKMKEVARVHSEACILSEIKHGPIALVDEYSTPCFILSSSPISKKESQNILEINSRKGVTIGVGTVEGEMKELCQKFTPTCHYDERYELTSPLLVLASMQLISYYTAIEKGLNPDMPINLAKCVTV